MKNAQKYDLKNEKNFSGNCLQKMKNYKQKHGKFDCDGSGEGNPDSTCILIREIYRELWGWSDVLDDGKIKRYATICLNVSMGPETINSFQTTYDIAKKMEGLNLERFANVVGRLVI